MQRYVTLLLRWEALPRRQQAYEQALAKLAATGEQLRPEWDALAADYRASLAELQALPLPLATVIRRVGDLFKAHLRAVYDKVMQEHGTPSQGSAFFALRDPYKRWPHRLPFRPCSRMRRVLQEGAHQRRQHWALGARPWRGISQPMRRPARISRPGMRWSSEPTTTTPSSCPFPCLGDPQPVP